MVNKKITAGGLALLLALSLTACGKKVDGNPPPPTPAGNQDSKAPGAYQVQPITADAAPQALKDWAAAEQDKTQPAFKVHEQDGVTYIAVTAGQQSSGGWSGSAQRTAVTQNGNKDVLELDVAFSPPAGLATMALTNPVVYFKSVPAVVGEVKVQVQVKGAQAGQGEQKPLTFAVEQGEGMGGYLIFHATGELENPKVEYRLNGTVLGSAELKAQSGGGWAWSLPRPEQRSEQIEIHLISGGESVKTAPMRYDTGVMQRWSANFYVDPPRQLDGKTLLLKGKARAFEAVFTVEVRQGGEVLARKPLQAKVGAPEYGDFEHKLELDREIPPGAEVWFMLESMKDGSDLVELIIPVVRGK